MIRLKKIALLMVFMTTLLVPGNALAKGLMEDKVVAGGTFILSSGESLDGNLLILGGTVTLELDSQVNGDVMLVGGSLNIEGHVSGEIFGLGGVINLGESATVDGNLTTIGAVLNRDPGSIIKGDVITGYNLPFKIPMLEIQPPQVPDFHLPVAPYFSGIWFLFRTFLWAALAVLLVMFLPVQTERTAQAVVTQPILAGGVGIMITVVAPLLLLGIAITIILIPISLVGALVIAIAWFFGRVAIGFEVGRRLGSMINQAWPAAVAAGVGTFVLTLAVDGANELIPCVGWLFPLLVSILGLGGVMLTRFGTQNYPPGNGQV